MDESMTVDPDAAVAASGLALIPMVEPVPKARFL